MATQYNEFEMHEAQEWREMHEALNEAHELQNEAHEMAYETSGRRTQRIVTPAVIIRITLAPMRGGKIFGTPKAIVGATQQTVSTVPSTGKAIVPIATRSATTGQTVGSGAVYVPKSNSNVIQASNWAVQGGDALQQAGSWVRKQVQALPTLKKRVRKVQVLIDGKPCASCVNQFSQNVANALPPNSAIKVRHTRRPTAATSTLRVPNTPQTTATGTRTPRLTTGAISPQPRPTTGVGTVPIRPRATATASATTRPIAATLPQRPRAISTTPTARPSNMSAATVPNRPILTAPRPQTHPSVSAARPTPPRTAAAASAPKSIIGQALKEVGM